MLNKRIVFLILLSALLVSACTNNDAASGSDKLSGKTFNISYPPVIQGDADSPNKYHSIMKIEFSDGNAATAAVNDAEGTYELHDEVLVIKFENDNEHLEIEFTDFEESDRDFSEYSTQVSRVEWEMIDYDKISHLRNLYSQLNKEMYIEFLKQ
ncbi:hypothetical protein MM300_13720 [Evansella sp. LMS18]|jgi:major membrane immunogen (membrane-anchored lipoprotein)|uniref:hypothetical protein n=1 Tax=Evansella sp. LMS18 TaxID=2924033 RepID=UPI0020D1418F|nr:hypothetical protein [Evansella sp. LMS18]UTR08988.1 hypothetical protein MM300_13720 [Evansella sp. LMS18]